MKVTKPELIVIPLLTLLAFGLRVFQLGGPSLWYDELLELDIVQGSFWDIGPQLVRHAAMPLDYFLLYGWIQLGRQEAWIRFPALLFGTLTIPLIYKLASACFNKRVGYLAALWLALASIAVYYSQDARPYAMLMFWVLLSFWGLWRAYQTGWSRYWSVTMVGLTGAALSHYFTLFLLLPLGLFVGVQLLSHLKDKSYWQHAIFFMICLMVLVAVFAFNGRLGTLYSVGDRFSKVVTQPETLTLPSYLKPNRGVGPPRHLGFVLTGVLIPLGTSNPISLLVLNSGLIIAFFSFLKFKERRAVALLFGWLVLPIVLIYLFLLQRGTFFAARYILYALPAYLILCAYGVEALIQFLTRRSRYIMGWASRKVLAGSLVVIVITILGFGEVTDLANYYWNDSREDWRAVGQLLHHNAAPEDAVIAVRAEPALNWYYPPARAPFGTYSTNQPIWTAMQQHQRRWFVLSSYSNKIDRGLRNWLKQNQAITIAIDKRVVVYLQQEDLSAQELLDQARTFVLPQKALTYAVLADQFEASGDLETSRALYQKAIELAGTPAQKADYQTRLATLSMLPHH